MEMGALADTATAETTLNKVWAIYVQSGSLDAALHEHHQWPLLHTTSTTTEHLLRSPLGALHGNADAAAILVRPAFSADTYRQAKILGADDVYRSRFPAEAARVDAALVASAPKVPGDDLSEAFLLEQMGRRSGTDALLATMGWRALLPKRLQDSAAIRDALADPAVGKRNLGLVLAVKVLSCRHFNRAALVIAAKHGVEDVLLETWTRTDRDAKALADYLCRPDGGRHDLQGVLAPAALRGMLARCKA